MLRLSYSRLGMVLITASFAFCEMRCSVCAQDSPDLDDQLLEDLENPTENSRPSTTARDPGAAGEDLGSEGENPIVRILEQMENSRERLLRGDASNSTVQLQRQIADDLGRLIAEIKQRQPPPGQSESNTTTNATQPTVQQLSSQTTDQNAADPLAPPDVPVGRNIWGHLPERVREQIYSSAIDEFLPDYADLIEAYYRRLAESPESTSNQN